jgi:hypothetical protein
VGLRLGLGVTVAVRVAVGVGVFEGVGVFVGVDVAVRVAVGVGVFEGLGVFVGVDVAVRVGEGVIERTGDGWEEGEIVFVIDGVESGVLKSTLPGPGEACSRQSPAIFVSMLAGKRSRECPEPASFTEGLKAKMELPQETTSTKESVPSRSKTSSPVLLR